MYKQRLISQWSWPASPASKLHTTGLEVNNNIRSLMLGILGPQCFEGFELINLKDHPSLWVVGGQLKLSVWLQHLRQLGWNTDYQQVINWILDCGCICVDGEDVGRPMVVTARLMKRKTVCFKNVCMYVCKSFILLLTSLSCNTFLQVIKFRFRFV